jgi:hypoxanthine phosphoribosyltransferase
MKEFEGKRFIMFLMAIIAIMGIVFIYMFTGESSDEGENVSTLWLQIMPSLAASLLAFIVLYFVYLAWNINLSPDLEMVVRELRFYEYWKDLQILRDKIQGDKRNFDPEIIITIGRGGAIAGAILASRWKKKPWYQRKISEDLPILGIDRIKEPPDDRVFIEPLDMENLKDAVLGKKVLLVMWAVGTGDTMIKARDELHNIGVNENDLKTAAVYKMHVAKDVINYYAESGVKTLHDPLRGFFAESE